MGEGAREVEAAAADAYEAEAAAVAQEAREEATQVL